MRKNLSLVVITLLVAATLCIIGASAAAKPDPQNFDRILVDKSKAVWEAYKTRNVAAIRSLSGADYVAFTLSGPSTLQQDIDTIDKLTIESYSVEDPKVLKVTKAVAILRYKCDLKGSFEGKPFRAVYATEVWVNRGGKWLIVSYSETPVS